MLNEFLIEKYYDDHVDEAPIDMSGSDMEPIGVSQLLSMKGVPIAALGQINLEYTSTLGSESLRTEISKSHESIGADDVVVFNSSGEAIFALLVSAVRAGDHVVAITPCYQSLVELAREQGAHVEFSPLLEEMDWQPDLTHLRSLIRRNTRAIIVNSPNNPTGQSLDPEIVKDLVRLAEDHNIIIVSDEIFGGLAEKQHDISPPMCEMSELSVTTSGLAKSFGLPGLRVGWLVTRNKAVREGAVRVKRYLSRCVSPISEYLSIIALQSQEKISARNRAILSSNRRVCSAFFMAHSDSFSIVPPIAGTTGFPRLLHDLPIDEFCQRISAEGGPFLLPGTVFGSSYRHFRIGLGHRNFPDALTRFRLALEQVI